MSAKNLVIVESPGKIKTISKYLGKDYTVMASMGHVRDLPKSKMGVDLEHDFKPQYLISKDKKKVVADLKAKIGPKTTVWIATDEDREGEAIGWHLQEALGLKHPKRIVFHEITESALKEAIGEPRTVDMHKVDAQQARRVLDRLVGYELSPLLWKKIQYGLSAGRVQSVALRLIVDREREIEAFIPKEYWSLEAQLQNAKHAKFSAKLSRFKGENPALDREADVQAVLKSIDGCDYTVRDIEEKRVERNPAAPFTTSTLQQEAARKLGFSVKKTMMVAQQLYEGVELENGHEGLITYMRTDSVNLSAQATAQAKHVIEDLYGKEFALPSPRSYKSRQGAQEAHEAIRPTNLARTPEMAKPYLSRDQLRLYELIWKRTLACQMAVAVMNQVGVNIEAGDATFRATGQTIEFAGFMQVYMEGRDEDEGDEEEGVLPVLKEGEKLKLNELKPEQHFTKPPARYTEASLVKKMEAEGIGRPSTYAPTISLIQTRAYVESVDRQLRPTDLGKLVCDFLIEHFPKIVDYHFTARMEQMLDEVQDGGVGWQKEVREFYEPFHKLVLDKQENVSREDVQQARDLGVDPKTGKPVSVRTGRYGPYLQLGTKDDADKPKFAPLPKEWSHDTVTLEQALPLFDLPRTLGLLGGEEVTTDIGRFGPYVKKGKLFVSLKDVSPLHVTLEHARELIEAEEKKREQRVIHDFGEIQVLRGIYGPYIKKGKVNAKIPKDVEPESLTLEQCEKIVADFKPGRRGFKRKSKK